jgi:hypothetical protein
MIGTAIRTSPGPRAKIKFFKFVLAKMIIVKIPYANAQYIATKRAIEMSNW